MRIVFATGIYPPDSGGPATYTRALGKDLVASGHTVQVVCYAENNAPSSDDGFPVVRISRAQPIWKRYWAFMQAVRTAAKEADFVYLQGPGSDGFPGSLGAWLAGKPTIMKVVGDYAWEIYSGAGGAELLDTFVTHRHSGKIRMLEAMERFTSRRAKTIITPSRYLKGIVEQWGVPSERITVIYNAVKDAVFGRTREEIRTDFGVADKRVLLSVIRAVPWKAGDFLIRLLKDLPPDVVLVIAGEGPMLETWQTIAHQEGVADRVRLLGRIDRTVVAEWYQASDLFLLATGYEGFPWVVVEAASAGLPSIVSDKGGSPETLELLGKEVVRVRPYQDREAWLEVLRAPWPARVSGEVLPAVLQERVMIAETMKVLQKGYG
ncbi:MAG: hypothetical protein RL141_667 [Candidatus Parcubacteria bacterium]|jgi:glycosyltransferase involved in cell wall biosynthesis